MNNGSNTVALFRRDGNGLKFDKLVTTTSAPVSVDFGNDHMYVAGATTVDSFVLRRNHVDGWTARPRSNWQEAALRRNGSTAQVGVIDERRLLVTLKTDPDPGTVDVVALHDGAIERRRADRRVRRPPARSRHSALPCIRMARR